MFIHALLYYLGKNSTPQEDTTTDNGHHESVDIAFSSFVDDMFDILKQEDFDKVHRKCLENLNVLGGISLSPDVEDKIDQSENLSELFKVMSRCRQYWNWMNIRILEKMACSSSAAMKSINKYKKKVYSKKVKDVVSEIPNLKVPTDKYTKVKEKWNKDFDDLTIKDIVKRWNEIEEKFNVKETMLLESITEGCVEICWLLRNDLVDHAIYSATKTRPVPRDDQLVSHNDQSVSHDNQPVSHDDQLVSHDDQPVSHDDHLATQQLFPEVLYLKIGDTVIKDHDITSKLHPNQKHPSCKKVAKT